jgi:PAS domain S-box-containing protein
MTNDASNMDMNYLRLLFNELGSDAFLDNYKNLADFFPAIVYVYDAEKKKIGYVNKQFSTLLGYNNDDLLAIDYDWKKIVFEEDIKTFEEALGKLADLQDNESYSYENRLSNKAGDWRYFRTRGTVLRRTTEGKAEAMLFVAEDITDQLITSQELEKTKALIKQTEQMHQFGIYSYDPEKDEFNLSEGIYELFEVKKEEHPKPKFKFLLDFVLTEDMDKLREMQLQLEKGTEDFENEFGIVTAAGNIKILLNIMKVVHDDNGEVIKYIGSLRDVTKDRSHERELQRSIKDLDTSNKELEEFAYIASHDMQEPLRKITTFSSRLNDKFGDRLGSEGKVYIDRMITAATNMRNLIENLLEVSRATRNTHPMVPVNLEEVVNTVVSSLEINIEEQKANIRLVDELPTIEAVPTLMQQLFSNLFTNAIKFSSKANPEITISSRPIDKKEREEHLLTEKPYYEITVADNGIGFEQEFAEKVFQIFQRLHGKAEYPGSGIGLSICKKIVEKHNGIIYAKSKPGIGSEFHIILPENQ